MSEFDTEKPTGNAGTMRTLRFDTARQIKELFDKCADPVEKTRLGELLEKLTKQHRPFKRQPKTLFK